MKKSSIAYLVGLGIFCSATTQAQKITLKLNNTTLPKVLKEITKQTGYVFLFDQSEISKKRFNINVTNGDLNQVFSYCNSYMPFYYKIIGRNVVLKVKENVNNLAQKFDMQGTIITENNTPVEDAALYEANTQQTIFTNKDGHYTLNSVAIGDSLVVSSVGYTSVYTVASGANMDIYLNKKSNDLDEVDVLAYGQLSSKRLNTGSAVKITAKDIQQTATVDPLQALQGRVAGLNITPTSGLSGDETAISLRGANTTGAANTSDIFGRNSNTPLFIVDGIPFNNSSISNLGNNGNAFHESPFKSIDPQNIESIEVLKDADATAIYGARGANGVILITTKKAKGGKLNFTANLSSSWQHIPKFVKMLNTSQYLAVRRSAFANDSLDVTEDQAPDLMSWDTTINHNWAKEFFNKTARFNTAEISANGGNAYNNFLASASYADQTSIYNSRTGLRRGSFMLSGNHRSKDGKLNINLMTMYTSDQNKIIPLTLDNFLNLPPNFSLYNTDGSFNWVNGSNPVASQLNTLQDKTKSLNTSLSASYNILDNLTVKINTGYNDMRLSEYTQTSIASQYPGNNPTATAQKAHSYTKIFNLEPQLNYELFKGDHHISVLIGSTYMRTKGAKYATAAINITNDSYLANFGEGATVNEAPPVEATSKFFSGFTRIGYDFMQKYVLNITARRDGSSRFGINNRYGNFGSVGAAWNISEEKFFEKLKPAISFAKIRASYGTTGNDQIGDYAYFVNQSLSSYYYQDSVYGYYASNLSNNNYKWETTRKLNIGFELGLFDNRIYITAEWYRNQTNNSLVSVPLPSFVGYTNVTENLAANILNTGKELTIHADEIKGKDFSWSTNFNIGFINNKLLSFPDLATSGYKNYYFIGKSIENVAGYVGGTLNSQTGAFTVKDLNNDGTIDPNDYSYLTSTIPKYTGGIGNSFSYKNFNVDIFFSFKNQGKRQLFTFYPGVLGYNVPEFTYNQIWKEAGDNAKFPAPSTTAAGNQDNMSYSYFNSTLNSYYSGSYIRLQSVSLSYQLPNKLLKKIGFSKLEAYGMANNLHTWTSNPGFDPETGMSMPNPRSFTVGIRTTF